MKKIAAAVCGGLMMATTLGACGGGGSEQLSTEEFCKQGEKMSSNTTNDPQEVAKLVQDLADKAPDAIQSDFQAVADAMADMKTQQDMQKLLTDPKLTKNMKSISTWIDQNCPNADSGS